nr:MAG TPA: hypothetical protein [Caudoviricetes sp.]
MPHLHQTDDTSSRLILFLLLSVRLSSTRAPLHFVSHLLPDVDLHP